MRYCYDAVAIVFREECVLSDKARRLQELRLLYAISRHLILKQFVSGACTVLISHSTEIFAQKSLLFHTIIFEAIWVAKTTEQTN